jgi:hypothetical protein
MLSPRLASGLMEAKLQAQTVSESLIRTHPAGVAVLVAEMVRHVCLTAYAIRQAEVTHIEEHAQMSTGKPTTVLPEFVQTVRLPLLSEGHSLLHEHKQC